MPDFTMCLNKKCKLKKECLRYRAVPGAYQAYAGFAPKKGRCDYFVQIIENDKILEICD